MMQALGAVVVAGVALLAPSPAEACSPLPLFPHEIDATVEDSVAPSVPTVSVSTGRADEMGTCEAHGYLVIDATATDDASLAEQIGISYRVVDGVAPPTFPYPLEGTYRTGEHAFGFRYDAPALAFTLEVRAVDRRGNMGPPILVEIMDDGPPPADEGCSTTDHPAGWGAAALALLLARRRRR